MTLCLSSAVITFNLSIYAIKVTVDLMQIYAHTHIYIQGVTGGMCETSGECSLC